jgi:hypothetical protein
VGLLVSWIGLVNAACATGNQHRTNRFEGAAELNSVESTGLISCCPDTKWRISGIGLFLNNKKAVTNLIFGHGESNPGLPVTVLNDFRKAGGVPYTMSECYPL